MFTINKDNTTVLIIDMQKTVPQIIPPDVYTFKIQHIIKLAKAINIFNLPYIITQHYTKVLGDTVVEITDLLGKTYYEKMSFSICKAKNFQVYSLIHTPNIIVIGAETHVCVLQTVLDLLNLNYKVHVIADGVMSRTKENWKIALKYMNNAGAIITSTETAIFQMLETAESKYFKDIIRLVK